MPIFPLDKTTSDAHLMFDTFMRFLIKVQIADDTTFNMFTRAVEEDETLTDILSAVKKYHNEYSED